MSSTAIGKIIESAQPAQLFYPLQHMVRLRVLCGVELCTPVSKEPLPCLFQRAEHGGFDFGYRFLDSVRNLLV